MNILFLDIDGVLNHAYSRERSPGGTTGVDYNKCLMLKRIINETDCKIVISSTWRKYPKLLEHFWDVAGTDIRHNCLGVTPVLERKTDSGLYAAKVRGDEIQAWLDEHPEAEVTRIVIVDDDSDMVHLRPFLVQTDHRVGMTEKEVNEIIRRFNDA